jgi:5'-3' exonuclease
VYTVLDKQGLDMNTLGFEKGEPCTPFQQLMMILPLESMTMLPPTIASLASSPRWKHLYPADFEVDALAGIKYIYSEAILPENEREKEFIENIREKESLLSPDLVARNKVSSTVKKFVLSTL